MLSFPAVSAEEWLLCKTLGAAPSPWTSSSPHAVSERCVEYTAPKPGERLESHSPPPAPSQLEGGTSGLRVRVYLMASEPGERGQIPGSY